MKHFNIKVSGRVQGVFFRASTKDQADELGIKGFVRNERDGGVYIEAEGEEEILNQFVSWCKAGPKSAVVSEVKIDEGLPRHFTHFEIKR